MVTPGPKGPTHELLKRLGLHRLERDAKMTTVPFQSVSFGTPPSAECLSCCRILRHLVDEPADREDPLRVSVGDKRHVSIPNDHEPVSRE